MYSEEIHGFASPGEFDRFIRYIEDQANMGLVQEVKPDLSCHKGEIYGGRWFKDINTNETWRLVEPDFPFKGLWEKVDSQKIRVNSPFLTPQITHSF